MRLHEYNVIASGVRLDEIPKQYRSLPLLGRGATTIAFEKDANTVLLFTRDKMKLEWLRDGLHLILSTQIIDPVKFHHISGIRNFPLYMAEMPKLYPLSKENRKIVVDEIENWLELSRDTRFRLNLMSPDYKGRFFEIVNRRYEEDHPDSILIPLFRFLINYDPKQFSFDLGARQFKQDSHGHIILLDPIIDQELMDLFKKHIKHKYG